MSGNASYARAFVVVAAAVMVSAGCGSSEGSEEQSSGPKGVPDSALDGLLLPVAEVESVMGTTGMSARQPSTVMADNRNMLPNLNCLGVWQVNEAPIYDPTFWKSVRQQVVRSPDSDDWDDLVVQSVVSWGTRDGAQAFFDDSVKRWSNCTNHTLNIRVNDRQLPAWKSGDLTQTEDQLTIPFARGKGDQTRSCQRALKVAANVVFDVQACTPPSDGANTKAADIAAAMEAKMPH